MLFSVVCIYKYDIKRFALGLPVVLALLFIYSDQIYSYFYSTDAYLRYMEIGLESDGREKMLYSYFDELTMLTIFTGVSLDQYPFMTYNHNPHNSLLNAHALFGIMSFGLGYIFWKIFKRLNMIAFIFAVVLIRSLTDTLLFVGVFDYLWMFVWLISVSKEN